MEMQDLNTNLVCYSMHGFHCNDLIADQTFGPLKHFHLCGTKDITSNLIMFLSNYCYNIVCIDLVGYLFVSVLIK